MPFGRNSDRPAQTKQNSDVAMNTEGREKGRQQGANAGGNGPTASRYIQNTMVICGRSGSHRAREGDDHHQIQRDRPRAEPSAPPPLDRLSLELRRRSVPGPATMDPPQTKRRVVLPVQPRPSVREQHGRARGRQIARAPQAIS